MGREKAETRRARERQRYAEDPEYRSKIQQQRKDHYERNKEAIKARVRERRAQNRAQHAEYERRRKYGMELADWDALVLAQTGRCAICFTPMFDPHVDHDHATGAVRGLLCLSCNLGLGHFKDSPARLSAAILYLS